MFIRQRALYDPHGEERRSANNKLSLALSGCGASRTMRAEIGQPSPSRRALAREYVLDANLLARPPQAEGKTSADFISQIGARRTG